MLQFGFVVTAATFARRLEAAEEKGRSDKCEKLIIGLAKLLYDNRMKAPDPTVTAQFCYLAREKSQYFRDSVIEVSIFDSNENEF